MSNVPIIELDLRHMREQFKTAIMTHNEEINAMVADAVERICTVENLQAKIDASIAKAMDTAINNLATDYNTQQVVIGIVNDALFNARQKIDLDGKS